MIELGNEFKLGTSIGFVGPLGVDIDISPRAMFNIDAKYVMLKTSVELDGADLGDLDINPILIG